MTTEFKEALEKGRLAAEQAERNILEINEILKEAADALADFFDCNAIARQDYSKKTIVLVITSPTRKKGVNSFPLRHPLQKMVTHLNYSDDGYPVNVGNESIKCICKEELRKAIFDILSDEKTQLDIIIPLNKSQKRQPNENRRNQETRRHRHCNCWFRRP